jgi:hypothetical protein
MATRKMAFGGMGKKMAGVAKAAAGKAAEANKAKEAQKSAMADKMKSAYTDFMAKKSAAPARPTERIPRPAGTVSPNAAKMVGKPLGGTPARPMGGGMGSMAGRGGTPTRPTGPMGTMARPAMTPQVKQGLQGMSDKLRAMPMRTGMKKGGKAGKK